MPEKPQRNANRRPESSEQRAECRYPQFLCIGAQKAGTTWLDSNLRRHPDLWLPPLKELHYFNSVHIRRHQKWTVRHRRANGQANLNRYLKRTPPSEYDYRHIARLADIVDGQLSDHWYGRIFALAPNGKICGEVCPDYCLLPPEGIDHVLRLSPDVKIILSLRDPIARSWSHLRMMMKTRGLQDNAEEVDILAGYPEFLQRADYPTIIDNWLRFIPRDRLLILFMDEIAESPNRVLESICKFLRVSYKAEYFKAAEKLIHAGEERPIPPRIEALLKEQFEPIYEKLSRRYPEFGGKWRESHYNVQPRA